MRKMMSHFDPSAYTVSVRRVAQEDGDFFEAKVAELPDVLVYEDSFGTAYQVAIEMLEDLKQAAIDQGRPFPEPSGPVDLDGFSGRVTLRMSKSLHAKISRTAEENGVSLNQWIVESISEKAASIFRVADIQKTLEYFKCGVEASRKAQKMHRSLLEPLIAYQTKSVAIHAASLETARWVAITSDLHNEEVSSAIDIRLRDEPHVFAGAWSKP